MQVYHRTHLRWLGRLVLAVADKPESGFSGHLDLVPDLDGRNWARNTFAALRGCPWSVIYSDSRRTLDHCYCLVWEDRC